MKSIDERAKMAACDCIEWYARKELRERNPNGCTDAILKALKEQRANDIEKVCEWIMRTPMYAKQPTTLVEEFKQYINNE